MKRYELLKDASEQKARELTLEICDALSGLGDWTCQKCPFRTRCNGLRNGVVDYLMEEVEK